MESPYQKEKSKLFGEILRPLIEFGIKTNMGWIAAMGYLDSGADITPLPLSFAKVLGIKIEDEEVKEIINNDNNSIDRYENLRDDLKHFKRVHVDRHFVLTFKVDKAKNFILFEDFEHHDRVY